MLLAARDGFAGQVAIQSGFDGLTKLLTKSAQLVNAEGLPPFYLKILVELETVNHYRRATPRSQPSQHARDASPESTQPN